MTKVLTERQTRWWVAEVAREWVANDNRTPPQELALARELRRWAASRREWPQANMALSEAALLVQRNRPR